MHNKIIKVDKNEILDIELEEDFIKKNMELANKVNAILNRYGIKAIDVMGSIGSGKTCLIGRLIDRLKDKYSIAMIGGDVATTIDTDRIAKYGIPVIQINTGAECHLDANLVTKALNELDLKSIDLLFIENVGNLICPADYPLGAHIRLVIISITEGPYSVIKHPLIFKEASICVINKIDLAEAMGINPQKLVIDAKKINPKIKTVLTSCRLGIGIEDLIKIMEL